MAKLIHYQDWVVKPGEDSVFVLAGLFRALHGLMRATGARLVVVPFHLDEWHKPALLEQGGAPQGLRVYLDDADQARYREELRLGHPLSDALLQRALKQVDETRVAGRVEVRRARTKSSPAALRRFERRNPGVDASGKVQHLVQERGRRPGIHIWVQRGDKKFPFFLEVKAVKEEAATLPFASASTYGTGKAPLVDFFL
ncbi:type I-F CRISPR-associated endoribonuclease Cas6/Csy4 [Halomonas sp.]|uniref:type I-F CRISPR-associated endoribonuclease Cas6/Csy4 n=1 Tax=Halomonas sp. TaxID=1486246 RepID=UPI003563F55B